MPFPELGNYYSFLAVQVWEAGGLKPSSSHPLTASPPPATSKLTAHRTPISPHLPLSLHPAIPWETFLGSKPRGVSWVIVYAFQCNQPRSFQQTDLLFSGELVGSIGTHLFFAVASAHSERSTHLAFVFKFFLSCSSLCPYPCFLSFLSPTFNLCYLVIYVYPRKHLKSFPETLGRNHKYHFYLHPESGGGKTSP